MLRLITRAHSGSAHQTAAKTRCSAFAKTRSEESDELEQETARTRSAEQRRCAARGATHQRSGVQLTVDLEAVDHMETQRRGLVRVRPHDASRVPERAEAAEEAAIEGGSHLVPWRLSHLKMHKVLG